MATRQMMAAGAILLLTGGLPLLLPTTANACSCMAFASPEEAVNVSSTIFLGTPTEKSSDGFEDTYQFDVSRVYKGDVDAVTSVGTLANGNGCGTSYVLGTEKLMFLSKPYDVDAEFEGYSCGPSTGSDFDVQATVESVYGDGYVPDTGGTVSVGVRVDKPVAIGAVAAGALISIGGGLYWKRRRSS
ncbi:hypothetical protein [Rhodococcus sp. IEGM 1379]|uniref:hypothetical protein n=1 Tax=Rhodococcus sp. IEGM 1379 TaxID=3047086 RepID=UPI0024B83B42|nr:hypothetical protein [Rhodococcus sp. IEGM 1379]MDI9917988.1 hypothetical protein [Rhodococcus sp. IEGM 1379]